MLTAVCEFLTDEADAIEVCPHGEFFVFSLRFPCRRAPLGERLIVEGEGKHDVAANLARVEVTVIVGGVEAP